MKNIKTLTIIGLLLIIAIGIWSLNKSENNPLAGRQTLKLCQSHTATSTPDIDGDRYILENNVFRVSTTATSTFECSVGNANTAFLDILFYGSTTEAYPVVSTEFSFDGDEWFVDTEPIAANVNSLEFATSTLSWEEGTKPMTETDVADIVATTSVVAELPLKGRFVRININSGTTSAEVYAELIRRNQN